MRRNNEDRLMGGHKPTPSEEAPQMPNPMDFVTPTEIVELPSKGRYPEGHPLHGCETIEIKHMTAKDEDILTNRSMLKKGIAIDRLIQNIIKDKSIDARSLYIGDRNAILIHSRALAYGSDYKTKVQCPACTETSKFKFDLNDHEVYHGDDIEGTNIEDNGDGTFLVELPYSTIKAVIRPLNGADELKFVSGEKNKDVMNNIITKQMKAFVVSFNGYSDAKTVEYVCDNMVAGDSRFLRDCFKLISPDIKMEASFTCKHCGHEEVVVVPFGADFFWPES
tara:strand:- start:438 stop:1274 length:837 start_codon:yes stop_codon:yes gene_type:complete